MSYDILVVGGGPAGLSAAINARARGKSVLVVSSPPGDNPLAKSSLVDNYLGLPAMTGAALLERFHSHAQAAGAEFLTGRALSAAFAANRWYVSVGSDVQEAEAVVLAPGVVRSKKFPGEAEFLGKGVSYCATCDGMLYRGRRVAVLGYMEAAREEADFLRGIGCQVSYLDRPKQCEISGGAQVETLRCDGEVLAVDGVFILRPALAPTDLFPALAVEDGFVAVDRRMATNLPGVFAAGDCTGGALQVSKAAGDGLVAGQSAAAYVDGLRKNRQS